VTEPAAEPVPACDFCGWIADRPPLDTACVPTDPGHRGYRVCGFCDISEIVTLWLNGACAKLPATIDQMRGFNLLRTETIRIVGTRGSDGNGE
jgi:hypothetical protein